MVRRVLQARLPIAIVLVLVLAFPQHVQSQWSTTASIDNEILGVGTNFTATGDGAGGAFITGKTSLAYVLSAQHITGSGALAWPAQGVFIDSSGTSSGASILDDTRGGAFITWLHSGTPYAVHLARIAPNGSITWNRTIGSSSISARPLLASDDAGGAYVAYFAGTSDRITLSRRISNGSFFYQIDPLRDSLSFGSMAISPDGFGGVLVLASTRRTIYLCRVDCAGVVSWTAVLQHITDGPLQEKQNHQICPDGQGGAWCFWEVRDHGIEWVRVSPQGRMIDDPRAVGATAYDDITPPENYSVAMHPSGAVGIVWQREPRSADQQIYGQVLDSSRGPLWGALGRILYATETPQETPRIIQSSDGNFIVTWSQTGTGILARKINLSGDPLWRRADRPGQPELTNVQMSTRQSPQGYLIPDGSGGAILALGRYAKRVLAFGGLGDPTPRIVSINDVTSDQGGRVRLRWNASRYDITGVPYPVTSYGIWRRILVTGSPAGEAPSGVRQLRTPVALSAAVVLNDTLAVDYEYVGSVSAVQSPTYSFVAPTLADSGSSDLSMTHFVVTAHTHDPSVYFISFPDSGYSVDNMPPLAPVSASVTPGPGQSWTVSWQPAGGQADDFKYYVIYRSAVPDFEPGPDSKLADVMDTMYVDTDIPPGSTFTYAITSVDYAGNESPPAKVTLTATGAEQSTRIPKEYALGQNYPNPFNPATGIRYNLPERSHVRLVVFNTLGEEVVRLIDGEMEAGTHEARFDARGLASGVYLYRMQAGSFVQTNKLVILK